LSIRILAALLIIDLLAFGAHPALAKPSNAPKTVAVVGQTAIPVRDISYRLKTEQAYENSGATEEVALISLINDAVEHEVASLNGVVATQEEIEALRKYSDEQTKAPEILKKVKMAFGDDSASYERLFLAPKIINRKLRQFYSRSPEIHKTERESIEKAYSLVSSGEPFQQAADQLGLQFKTFEAGNQDTSSTPGELKRHVPEGARATPPTDPLIPILEHLSAGDINRSIVEDDYSYKVIRLKEKKGKTYQVESITVYKRPFDEWFRKEAEKIRIEILDSEFKKSIQIRYPNLWWTPNLSP
jgi:hypothetical protein